jgi:hypothetical protein
VNGRETVGPREDITKTVGEIMSSRSRLPKQLLGYREGFCHIQLKWKQHMYLNSDGLSDTEHVIVG